MVKVIYPLQGEEAHGSIGKAITFQGTNAKKYRAPRIAKVAAQYQAEDKFQSATKIIRQLNSWGRGALRTMLGSNWFSALYRQVTISWNDAEALFNSYSEGDRATWAENAPYTATRLDCGLTFYACAYAVRQVALAFGPESFAAYTPTAGGSSVYRTWWDRSMDRVFGAGMFDDLNSWFNIPQTENEWVDVEDVNAYGGSYKLSPVQNVYLFSFKFYGSRLGVLYHQSVDFASMAVKIDNDTDVVFSQNDAEGMYQVEWLSAVLPVGLHQAMIWRTGPEGSVSFDGAVIYG